MRKMDRRDIKEWIIANSRGLMLQISLSLNEIDHITICMEDISRWYYENYPIGDFLTAVVKNDFSEACFQADDTNRKVLYLYALFLANKIPYDYRLKANR